MCCESLRLTKKSHIETLNLIREVVIQKRRSLKGTRSFVKEEKDMEDNECRRYLSMSSIISNVVNVKQCVDKCSNSSKSVVYFRKKIASTCILHHDKASSLTPLLVSAFSVKHYMVTLPNRPTDGRAGPARLPSLSTIKIQPVRSPFGVDGEGRKRLDETINII